MSGLVTTFQFRPPRGPHEAILDRFAALFGASERRLHRELAQLSPAAAVGAEAHRAQKNALKRRMIAEEGLTSRHYNSILNALEGRHDSLRELAKGRIATMKRKLKQLEKKMAPRQKIVAAYEKACAEIKARQDQGKKPTKALLAKMEKREAAQKERAILHQQKRRQSILADRIAREEKDLARIVPKLVFGSKGLLQQRGRIHPHDLDGLRSWRRKWEMSRSRQILLVGSSDETAGCQSCVASLQHEGTLSLRVRLPEPLATDGKYLNISGIDLPEYAQSAVAEALRRHADTDERGPALIRTRKGFRHGGSI